jgi:hypothetical protein
MDFTLSEDQQTLLTAFDGLLDRYRNPPHGSHDYVAYDAAFQQELHDSGFTEIAAQNGFGLLDAALLVEAAAACPVSVEVAASMMVGPLLDGRQGPIAVAWGVGRPVRFLEQAQTLCVIDADEVWLGTPGLTDHEPVQSVAAYPMAKLLSVPADARLVSGDLARAIHRRAIVGIAAEAAGIMRGALEHTIRYVKDRQQFGQPLGNFQAIQHRLAEDAQMVQSARLLAFRAAFDDADDRAATACLYAQVAMRKVIYDCHQFSGAMGLTLEFPLHLWTYRLKCLQGEAGGRAAQGKLLASETWGADAEHGERQRNEIKAAAV